ncbi:hypothetical protein DL546_006274 [Coniochaeta pulveracea]|uniref:DUF1308 domain-containing protein n=1 Tax=Coniochaeta pulveracea TaxID=177199 RepID=A0A420YJ20_9PEZI|nr:hypothetical protein DL546_006274 [Coniochaeta pulveracea]
MASTDDDDNVQTLLASVCAKAEEIIQRTASLLSEYQQYNDLRQKRHNEIQIPGQKTLVQSVKAEHIAFQRTLEELQSESFLKEHDESEALTRLKKIRSALQCSNVPSLETAWDVVKHCHGLDRLTYKFSRHANVGKCPICKGQKKCPPKGQQDSKSVVWVDAVVKGGAEWLRIIGIEEKRLLMHMAQGGWDWEVGSDSEDEEMDEDSDISVVVTVRQLIEAALVNRHEYKPPRLRIMFTRIVEGSNSEVDRLIRQMRGMGREGVEVQIVCSNSDFLMTPPPSLEVALENLMVDDTKDITSVVNLDCSILVSLASDVTHSHVEIQPWHRNDVSAQIREEEAEGSSLVKKLYPALRGKKLVCTAEAARRFRAIVATIATKDEAARTRLILPDPGSLEKTSTELVAELQALSVHPVGSGLLLPVEVVDHDYPARMHEIMGTGKLPLSAKPVAADLSELNWDIFCYGWVAGITTITANYTLAKQIVRLVEQGRTEAHEEGPKVWVFPYTRALATKGRPEQPPDSPRKLNKGFRKGIRKHAAGENEALQI